MTILHIFDSKMVQNLWKQPWIRVTTCFFVVSNHLGKHKTIFQNWEKNDEVGLTPPGQPVFWVSQLFAKLEMQLKKFDLMFFFQIFLHRHLG